MHTKVHTPCNWSTASFGDAADTSPADLSALGSHLHLCQCDTGRWFALRCMTERMTGFATARFITTLVVVALLLTAASFTL